jgi:hypothetical protein
MVCRGDAAVIGTESICGLRCFRMDFNICNNLYGTMIGKFGDMEEVRLSIMVEGKRITIIEDETFHPQICLVAIEPESNYIILERYAKDRSGATWNEALTGALGNIPVKIIQGTRDEEKGLINHVTKGLNGHHSPDLFHVMYEISKGTSAPLSAAVRKAEKTHENTTNAVDEARNRKAANENLEKRPVGRAPDFDKRISRCREKETKARASLKLAMDNRETVTKERKNIGRTYHPYDPFTGKKQDAPTVGQLLEESFDQIRQASDSLGDKSKERIEKAWRVTEKMTTTIAFFFGMIESLVNDMNLSHDKRELMHNRYIPGFYLKKISQKEKDLERKQRIRQRSLELLSVLTDKDGPFSICDDRGIARMVKKAKACAGFSAISGCRPPPPCRRPGYPGIPCRPLSDFRRPC